MFKNKKPEFNELTLEQLIKLAQRRTLVIVLKNGDHATYLSTALGENYLVTNTGKSIPMSAYDNDLTYTDSPDYDIVWIYGRKKCKSLFIRDFEQVIYDNSHSLTFDQARNLAGENYVFKHESMPHYLKLYGVLEWLHKNRNTSAINEMLSDNKWRVMRDYKDPHLK